jgi:hypothetical protein
MDGDDDLIETPNIATARQFALQAAHVVDAEFDRPASNRFVGDNNAALQQYFFDQTQAQSKTEI